MNCYIACRHKYSWHLPLKSSLHRKVFNTAIIKHSTQAYNQPRMRSVMPTDNFIYENYFTIRLITHFKYDFFWFCFICQGLQLFPGGKTLVRDKIIQTESEMTTIYVIPGRRAEAAPGH